MGKKTTEPPRKHWRHYVLPALACCLVLLAVLVTFQEMERFLIHDVRFGLRRADLPGQASPDLRITGLNRTSAAQVRKLFTEDAGRSVYLLPLAERRESIRAIGWVKDASVSRAWPNRVEVRIQERKPQAFVRLAGGGRAARPMLIDEDGVILPVPHDPVRLELPVLAGIGEHHTQQERAVRVRLLQEVEGQLGSLKESISEYDLHDLSCVRLAMQVEGEPVVVLVGTEHYARRVELFLRYFKEIRRKAPGAGTFDLRLEGRITVVEQEPDGT
ncbi:MAG: FtsQ-type POTRA domain-containing protein [Acidimicrobiia bacterium]|nr:FtsQ-type POTRA domain-containing protein [Acidimicrobiia bacterium]